MTRRTSFSITAKAAETRVRLGMSTRARETAELTSGDWERNQHQLAREETARRAAGLGAPAALAPPQPAAPTPDPPEDEDDQS